jgi:two-component system nitrate/nitrite response regulator NarL
VIVEPRTLLREGLSSLLHDSNFKVISSVASVDEMPALPPGRAGLLIIGIARATPDDLLRLERIVPRKQEYKIVAVADGAAQSNHIDIALVLRSGADGYILNIQSRDVLLKSLELTFLEQKLVVLGDKPDTELVEVNSKPAVSDEAAAPRLNGNGASHPVLSSRELEILACLACGDSNKVIARTCRIAESTVKIHLKSILRKIQVQNRTQAAIWAIENRLARLPSPRIAPTELERQSLHDLFALEDLPPSDFE